MRGAYRWLRIGSEDSSDEGAAMGYSISSLDELGEGYGFRKVRQPLGVTAFGVNALVFPPRYEGPNHYHDTQDELYFVHRGTAIFNIDGKDHRVEPGGLV